MQRILFFLFFISGFCGLVYQVIWIRMAYASFGIISPVLSVILATFMLGLALGSWSGGRLALKVRMRAPISGLGYYAIAELLIGLGAFAVPKAFVFGEHLLLTTGQMDSLRYAILSGLVMFFSLLPWCVCMGSTFPFVMGFIREQDPHNRSGFSYLYVANLLGAISGTLLTALVFIEVLGFTLTCRLAATANFAISVLSFWIGRHFRTASATEKKQLPKANTPLTPTDLDKRSISAILFTTGFCAMASEVVWSRAFTYVLQTQVYAFAAIVFTYLSATFVGSWWYRHDLQRGAACASVRLLSFLMGAGLLPAIVNSNTVIGWLEWKFGNLTEMLVLLASICPFCAVLGYLTPKLIDESSAGDPALASSAYAVNIVGCILGPLFASYVLLPHISERYATILLNLPFAGFVLVRAKASSAVQRVIASFVTIATLICALRIQDFESFILHSDPNAIVRRDYAASVFSYTGAGEKYLLVNGVGVTVLTPITKFMAHLPLALQSEKPRSALIICFGMGTTYRSALSWDINTTAVELVPSVIDVFGFYHSDAEQYLRHPNGHIVVDDGRRYLNRTTERFDLIVIDPPPPVAAAGSSLLYSEELYALAKKHLKQHGILQAWIPYGDPMATQAAARSIQNSFPNVRWFRSIDGWGLHMLASMEPIEVPSPNILAARMPENARNDLMEWNHTTDLVTYLQKMLAAEVTATEILNQDHRITITDDRPYNEYFLIRRLGL